CGGRWPRRGSRCAQPSFSGGLPRTTAPRVPPTSSRRSLSRLAPASAHVLDELGLIALDAIHPLTGAAAQIDHRVAVVELDRPPGRAVELPVLEVVDGDRVLRHCVAPAATAGCALAQSMIFCDPWMASPSSVTS